MANIFDQFDAPAGNVFDQFDAGDPMAPQGPEQPDIGRTRAAITSAAQGVSGNFADEIAGLKRGLSRWVFEKLGGDGQSGQAREYYRQGRDQMRADTTAAQSQYPYTYTAAEVAGAIANPLMRVNPAATMTGRVAQGAGLGAAYGGVSGLGEGTTAEDRFSKGVMGAGIGGVAGGIAPPVVEGALQAGRFVARPITEMVRGAINPGNQAARRIVETIERDIGADPAAAGRLTPAEFMASRGEGARVMDMGGERTRAIARSAANSSPEGRDILTREVARRFETQTERVSNWFRGAFHFPDAAATQEALQQTARGVNRATYRQAYNDGADGLWTPTLERLAGTRAVSNAMRTASENAGDEAVVAGYGAMSPRISFTPDGRIQFQRAPNGMPTYPDMQFWDLTQRELRDAAQRAGRGTSEARRIESLRRMLNAELDHLVPSFGQARRGAAQFFGADDALEAGRNFVTQDFNHREVRQQLARMSDIERRLFQDGFVDRFLAQLNKINDNRNILNKINGNPAAREKLDIALGPQRARELEARLRVEEIMDRMRPAVTGNSTTARQIAEWGLSGSAGLYGVYNMDPTSLMAAALIAGRRNINERVARQVAEMLVSPDPHVLQRGLNIVTRNNQMMESLRRFHDRLAVRAGAQQGPQFGPALPPIHGTYVGAAANEEQ